MLPDVLDVLGVPADEARGEVPARALDGLGVPLERALAPADDPELCLDAHEEPARGDAEDLRMRAPRELSRRLSGRVGMTHLDLGDLVWGRHLRERWWVGRCTFELTASCSIDDCAQ